MVGAVSFGVVAMVAVVTSRSPHPQLLDVVWCSAAVVVVVVCSGVVLVVYCSLFSVVAVAFVVV